MIADATQVQGVTTCYINMEPGVFMNKNSYGVIGKFNLTCQKYILKLANEK